LLMNFLMTNSVKNWKLTAKGAKEKIFPNIPGKLPDFIDRNKQNCPINP